MPPRQEAPSYDLTDPDIDVLIDFCERYNAAKRHQRKPLLDEATQAIVTRLEAVGLVTTKVKMSITKAVSNWMLNEVPNSVSNLIGFFMRKWSPKSVLEYLMFEDIKERQQEKKRESDDPKGTFKYYQIVVSELMRGLDPDMKREHEKCAAEWNRLGPPPAVQQRAAEKRAMASVTKFLRLMQEKLGVYAVTLFGYKGSDGKIIYFCIDTPGCGFLWENEAFEESEALVHWARWLKTEIRGSDRDKNSDASNPRSMPSHNKKVKENLQLEIDNNNYPILPDPLPNKKAQSGGKSGVPWAQVSQEPELWMDPKWIPSSGVLQDPSQMHRDYSYDMLMKLNNTARNSVFRWTRTSKTLEEARKAPPFNPKAQKGKGKEKHSRKTKSTSKQTNSNSTGSGQSITTRSKEDETEDEIASMEEEDYRTSDEEGDKGDGSDVAGSDGEGASLPEGDTLTGVPADSEPSGSEQYPKTQLQFGKAKAASLGRPLGRDPMDPSLHDHASFRPYPKLKPAFGKPKEPTLPKSSGSKSTGPSSSNCSANEPSLLAHSPPHTGNAMDVNTPTATPKFITSLPTPTTAAAQSPLTDAGNLPLPLLVRVEKRKRAEKQWSTPAEPTLKTGPPKKRPKVSDGSDVTPVKKLYISHSPCPAKPAPKRPAVPRTLSKKPRMKR
ncbi:hypothetical protein JAAARDRAFT_188461 [Jaapia argillacea MUCL 33604]|uniref:Uncharacterized protein n=1 Tax=Jaapia argillacea MUCL 33604 TaxID=933084 RepID=A0A067QR67_9AGAM|nr:hypothetical protein JAAARDRAFT_188461 [Jaapia argillacea MUCL 33604]